jgi:hypothetical protein
MLGPARPIEQHRENIALAYCLVVPVEQARLRERIQEILPRRLLTDPIPILAIARVLEFFDPDLGC